MTRRCPAPHANPKCLFNVQPGPLHELVYHTKADFEFPAPPSPWPLPSPLPVPVPVPFALALPLPSPLPLPVPVPLALALHLALPSPASHRRRGVVLPAVISSPCAAKVMQGERTMMFFLESTLDSTAALDRLAAQGGGMRCGHVSSTCHRLSLRVCSTACASALQTRHTVLIRYLFLGGDRAEGETREGPVVRAPAPDRDGMIRIATILPGRKT